MVVAFAVLALSTCRLSALQPTALPDFQLATLDGQTIRSADLPAKGHWLLIYVESESHFCEKLLKHFSQRATSPTLAKVVVIVKGTPEEAKAMRAHYPYLAQAFWYSDPSDNAFTQLKLNGIPVTLGVDQHTVQWVNNGVLPDSKTQNAILFSWLQ